MCPYCDRTVSTLVFLIICAYCERAWLPYEYDLAWRARDEREQALESEVSP